MTVSQDQRTMISTLREACQQKQAVDPDPRWHIAMRRLDELERILDQTGKVDNTILAQLKKEISE